MSNCAPLAESAGVAVIVSTQEKPLPLRMSPARLVQVFQNLLQNAIQYSGHGATVEIEITTISEINSQMVKCIVKDRGLGFKTEDLPRLFDPFFTKRLGGTGLGLSIVQRIVEEHGGRIIAANRAGDGAQITVVAARTQNEDPLNKQ